MAIRVRKDGRMFCAALRPAKDGDTYIDDTLHHQLCAVHRVIVSEPADQHQVSAEWWWRGAVPSEVEIDPFYQS